MGIVNRYKDYFWSGVLMGATIMFWLMVFYMIYTR